MQEQEETHTGRPLKVLATAPIDKLGELQDVGGESRLREMRLGSDRTAGSYHLRRRQPVDTDNHSLKGIW